MLFLEFSQEYDNGEALVGRTERISLSYLRIKTNNNLPFTTHFVRGNKGYKEDSKNTYLYIIKYIQIY